MLLYRDIILLVVWSLSLPAFIMNRLVWWGVPHTVEAVAITSQQVDGSAHRRDEGLTAGEGEGGEVWLYKGVWYDQRG